MTPEPSLTELLLFIGIPIAICAAVWVSYWTDRHLESCLPEDHYEEPAQSRRGTLLTSGRIGRVKNIAAASNLPTNPLPVVKDPNGFTSTFEPYGDWNHAMVAVKAMNVGYFEVMRTGDDKWTAEICSPIGPETIAYSDKEEIYALAECLADLAEELLQSQGKEIHNAE